MASSPSPSLTSTNVQDDIRKNISIIWIPGLLFQQLHIIGTFYVLINVFLRWKRSGSLTMAVRLPMYIAIIDFFLYFLYMSNGITTLSFGHPINGEACSFLGGFLFYLISCNITLVLIISLTTYLRVCHKIYISFGCYDWKLLTVTLLLPVVFTAIAIPSFGDDIYWCYSNRDKLYIAIIDLVLFFGVFLTCAYCYRAVVKEVRRAKQALNSTTNSRVDVLDNIEERLVMKVISYVLMFFFNWGPSMPYLVSHLLDRSPVWVYVADIIGCGLGGTLNGIQYIINEGLWSIRQPQSEMVSSNTLSDIGGRGTGNSEWAKPTVGPITQNTFVEVVSEDGQR